MKRLLLAMLVFFAGALVASARVSWIPMTTNELVAFEQGEINGIEVVLCKRTNGTAVWAAQDGQPRTNTWNLFQVMTNVISSAVGRYILNNDNAESLDTNSLFYVEVFFTASYGSTLGSSAIGFSSDFRFATGPINGGGPPIPAQAFDVRTDWLWYDLILPAPGVRWVEFYLQEGGYEVFYDLTRNGAHNSPTNSSLITGFIHISPGDVWMWDITRPWSPDTPQGTFLRYTLWYNEERTDGTEWLFDSTNNVTKREIYPPSPPRLSVGRSGSRVTINLTGGAAGTLYALESSEAVELPFTKVVGTVTADAEGKASWTLTPNPVQQFFRARLANP